MDYKQKYQKYKRKYLSIGGTNDSENQTKSPLSSILNAMFKHQLQIKMLHFTTKSFSVHKSLDIYLVTFRLLFDKFMEVSQGIESVGQLNVQTMNINATGIKDGNELKSELDNFVNNTLNGKIMNELMTSIGDPKSLGLLSIRDEIIDEAQKLRYLLLFK